MNHMESLTKEELEKLVNAAASARLTRADAKISGFTVGAALLAENGSIFSAGNIECFGQTASICSERTALFKAVSENVRDFKALAVCGGPKDRPLEEYCYPCGVCRQVLMQFCPEDMPVICLKTEKEWRIHTLKELLPYAWTRRQ